MSVAPTPSRLPRTVAPKSSVVTREPTAPLLEAAPDVAVAEERRWFLTLVVPFILGAIFIAAGFATGNVLWIAPAMLTGVMCLIFAFIYLALTSESN